jgi:hypothetical protein
MGIFAAERFARVASGSPVFGGPFGLIKEGVYGSSRYGARVATRTGQEGSRFQRSLRTKERS